MWTLLRKKKSWEAKHQLQTQEDYGATYTTYSFEEIQLTYEEFVTSEGTILRYGNTVLKRTNHAVISCYYTDRYYHLRVCYYNKNEEQVYIDQYTVAADGFISAYDTPYLAWIEDSLHTQVFLCNPAVECITATMTSTLENGFCTKQSMWMVSRPGVLHSTKKQLFDKHEIREMGKYGADIWAQYVL